ncbi:NR LBD domain-containing protein [Caenorhabditis elegans]|uniref:NR LBD domain-containing protein n=1 Tax=Caenorhabditis elegans TaxID=6239 RepID=A0A679L8S1_CAEEL|nr:NR LBD domain-containing protein [Caenorhabditis elegans]CAA9991448.1 NR LBD domain-containing protein [Caenorhabditis elegans]
MSNESSETMTKKEEEAEKKIEIQIEEHIKLFEDPTASFEEKMKILVKVPTELQHNLLNRERSDRLFASIPIEMFQRIFEPMHEEYAHARPILIHILSFLCQCTSPEVHLKFKILMENVIKSVAPRGNKAEMNSTVYNDMSLIVAVWANTPGEGKYVYELLRHTTNFFAAQKQSLDVGQFLLSIRMLLGKIYQIAPMERPELFDNRGWPVGILAVLRCLLQERHEKFSKEMRALMWDVLSSMTKLGGIAWFNIDKTFAKMAIQMNHVEMQMSLHDPQNLDVLQFCRHLRILELYTNAICDSEMFGEDGMEVIPHTVGDSTKFILLFWVEAYLQKIQIPTQMSLSIFNFAVFLFCHEELAITEEKVRKHIGEVMLDTAFTVLEEASESDLRGEVGQLFSDILERLAELEVLNERVPLFLMKYLDKIRCAEDYEGWKGRVIDCKCCIMDLRGRVDWYSVKTLKESRQLLPKFTDPEQHELGQLFTIFDKLPRVN